MVSSDKKRRTERWGKRSDGVKLIGSIFVDVSVEAGKLTGGYRERKGVREWGTLGGDMG